MRYVVMRLYGIDYNATQDGVVTVDSLTLSFSVNGVPAYQCEYSPALRLQLTPELGSPVRLQLFWPSLSSDSNRRFQSNKRGQLFIRAHNETLSVGAMWVCNPDCSPVRINRPDPSA